MISYIILITSITIASFSQILLKKAADKQYSSPLRQYLNFYVISGYCLTFISVFLTTMAYKGLEYKNGPLIESLGFILVIILSRIFFKEKITNRKLLGMTIIIIGIIIFYL